jgi:hypothetical protein
MRVEPSLILALVTKSAQLGEWMYRITVQYSKAGLVAYDLNGDALIAAREKATHFKSQGF